MITNGQNTINISRDEIKTQTDSNTNGLDQICILLETMGSVDISSTEAELNKTSISDNKGGRILL